MSQNFQLKIRQFLSKKETFSFKFVSKRGKEIGSGFRLTGLPGKWTQYPKVGLETQDPRVVP